MERCPVHKSTLAKHRYALRAASRRKAGLTRRGGRELVSDLGRPGGFVGPEQRTQVPRAPIAPIAHYCPDAARAGHGGAAERAGAAGDPNRPALTAPTTVGAGAGAGTTAGDAGAGISAGAVGPDAAGGGPPRVFLHRARCRRSPLCGANGAGRAAARCNCRSFVGRPAGQSAAAAARARPAAVREAGS